MTTARRSETSSPAELAPAIRAAIGILRVDASHVLELRALKVPARYGRPAVVAGWFDDPDSMTQAAIELERRLAPGVYFTLNPCNEALLCRGYNRLVEHPASTTADHDILRRVWLPIDVDPVRPSGTSASDAEIELARARALDVAAWLATELHEEPDVWAFSGNGFHLLTRIDLQNDERTTRLVKGVIESASKQFSDATVTIDTTVCNAARIWKLYGTTARKGDEVPRLGRVHRRAEILKKGFER